MVAAGKFGPRQAHDGMAKRILLFSVANGRLPSSPLAAVVGVKPTEVRAAACPCGKCVAARAASSDFFGGWVMEPLTVTEGV